MDRTLDDLAVENLRKYLRIPSVHPDVDYGECVKFLKGVAADLELPVSVIYLTTDKPAVVVTWEGTEPDLPSILLNSHMDVVAVVEEKWERDPFAAEIVDGKIYARGSQDMKSVGIVHLESIRRLRSRGVTCSRTIHVSFVPDEERGGKEGMNLFVRTKEFKHLNVGASFDESYAQDTENFFMFFAEKTANFFNIHCDGKGGHGSLLIDDTPGEKVNHILNKAYEYRRSQQKKLKDDPALNDGDITSINCTVIEGGVQQNVIPGEMTLKFDCRMSPKENLDDFENMLKEWCRGAGQNCTLSYFQKEEPSPVTRLDNANVYWTALQRSFEKLKIKVIPEVCVGNTDSRYLRKVGVDAFGFTPFNNTPMLLHSENEFISVQTFLRGIEIFTEIISNVANAK